MAKTLVAIVAVGATCASLGYSGRMLRHGHGSLLTPPSAATAPLRSDRVVALGRIEPHGGIVAVNGPRGTRLAELCVSEGDHVRRGDTLARLEGKEELLAQRAQLEAQIREAEDRLDAERRYEQVLKAEAEIARQELIELEPRVLEAQRAKIELLRENLRNSSANLSRLEGLPRNAAVSQQEYDQGRLLVRRDQEELHCAELLLGKLQKALEINEKKVDVELEKAELGSLRVQRAIPLESLRASVALVDARLEQLEVKAPIDGRVLKVVTQPGEATGPQPILQLGAVETMDVIAEVYETDRKRVREGQRAEVTSPALPDGHAVLHGVVERIGWTVAKNDVLGLDPAADAYARVVEVRVRLDPEDSRAVAHLTHLQVDVTIETAPQIVALAPGATAPPATLVPERPR